MIGFGANGVIEIKNGQRLDIMLANYQTVNLNVTIGILD
jgi:hypothetical protein